MTKKKQYDKTRPEAKEIIDEVVHGTFMKEGTMVAFPLCFPTVTVPIAADESHITALDVTSDGIVYGGTSGRITHLFVGMFHGVTGMVFDMGAVEGTDSCAAICCGVKKFIACVNGPDSGRIIMRNLQELPFDLIQEWSIFRQPFEDLGEVAKSEKIVHAVRDCSRKFVVGITERHLFVVDIESMNVEVVADVHGVGRLAVGSKGNIFGLDKDRYLWRYEPKQRKVTHKAVKLPEGDWPQHKLTWARNSINGTLYTADTAGHIFSFSEEDGFSERLGRTKLTPIGPMAVTFDGRLFGFCGDGISNMFCYNPNMRDVTNIGVAVSVLERRRYGYVFADAAIGRDGQIFFGEDDDLGHLWMYFPAIQPQAR